jgi:hypothetical protein
MSNSPSVRVVLETVIRRDVEKKVAYIDTYKCSYVSTPPVTLFHTHLVTFKLNICVKCHLLVFLFARRNRSVGSCVHRMKISNLYSHLDQPPDKDVPDCDDGDSLSNLALQVVLILSLRATLAMMHR